ncbi:L,D-transpeptidase [Rhizomonospora bruguierae]|uniref:L,D-transpeptidase n=1 Tax=Rhizomonospora bruguierae TaxID=1581705 RepID=UPI001BCFB344|nr:Ig-like domain-containing protein [Micromonospora sp. NBRC 107566]
MTGTRTTGTRRGGRTAHGALTGAFAAALAAVLLLAGCTSGGGDGAGSWQTPAPQVNLKVTPADNATGVPVSAELSVRPGEGTTVDGFKLAADGGAEVEGAMREDGSSWVPASPLKYDTRYTVTVTAKPEGGDPVDRTTTFTTMSRPGNRLQAHVYMADDATYGQAMPIVVEFKSGGVAPKDRADVERRLFVRSDPPQEGAWHWDSNIQVEYRPREYWQPGTRLDVRLGLGGLPIGDGRYGATDITIRAAIDTVRRSIEVDDATKKLVAKQDGQVVKTFPVSLGRPAKPSFSGTMVIMERLAKTVFDSSTYGTPVNSPDGYRTDIQFAERLTWDGQFIHAAPWSVPDQGKRNVSHGCVNVSTADGQWIYNWVRVGDPVVVKGTGRKLNQGNGFTAWNLSWDEVLQGSALDRQQAGDQEPTPTTPPS